MRVAFNILAGFSIALNLLLLSLLLWTPYSQALHFTALLKGHFGGRPVTLYTLARTPFETEHHLPFVFYQQGALNLRFHILPTGDSLRRLPPQAEYLTATYDQVKDHQALLDSLGYTRVLYSSRLLWGIDAFLDARGINTINDIWVLYRRR
jgi:hypothetical protein